jgi:putative secretion ATPase (PEP-CTERM system associated)
MFTQFYKLSGRPFQLTPDHRFFFGSRNHTKAMAYLTFGINTGEGFVVITGDVGTGKSTLVDHLLSLLDSSKYVAAKVVTTQLDADNILRAVAISFGIPQEGVDKATLLRRLEEFLYQNQRDGRRLLLLIDEAQNLPARSLEELRMLSNFQTAGGSPIQVFLLGQPQFRRTLASESLIQLRQRVIATHHLGPMDGDETRAYIEHRLRIVGWTSDPEFTPEAFSLIHLHTAGVPRRINTLCTRLLLYGMLEEQHRIDGRTVEQVVGELQQEGQALTAEDPEPPAEAPEAPAAEVPRGEATDLARRVAVLERRTDTHERAIRRALALANESLEELRGGRAAPLAKRRQT